MTTSPRNDGMFLRVIDVETTGLAPPDGVVEFACHDLLREQADWQIGEGRSWLCHPGCPIPPEASAIHHIIDEDVVGCDPFDVVCRRAFEGSQPAAVAAHNDRFDRQWVTAELLGKQAWIDTYRCALRLWPEAPGHTLQTLRYWRRLAGIDRAIAIPHRASGDAYVTAHLLLDMLSLTTGKQLVAWSSGPALLPRFTFGKHAMKPLAEVEFSYLEWMVHQDFDEDVLFTARHEIERRQKDAA